jgi:hypothetical protein
MRLKIHPDAARAVNTLAAEVLLKPFDLKNKSKGPTWGEQHISAHFTDNDIIGAPLMYEVDVYGNKVSATTVVDGTSMTVDEESYKTLETLAQRTLGISVLKRLLSDAYVKNIILDWCVAKHRGDSSSYSDYLLDRAGEDVSDHRIWMPIAFLQVQQDFSFGPGSIITIPQSLFDDFERSILAGRPDDDADTRAHFHKLRGELQGNAAVSLGIRGEELYAKQQARNIAEDIVGLLRFMHYSAFTHKTFCPMALLGAEFMPKVSSMKFVGPNRFNYSRGLAYPNEHTWRISRMALAEIRDDLTLISDLATAEGLSDFASRVRTAILTYSRGMTYPNISDRLVYSLSALEGLLLKDTSEPIQQNLAERMAFISYKDTDDRIKTVSNIKKIYAARSQYIHHQRMAQTLEDDLESFFITAWATLKGVLANVRRYSTTTDFISAIDRLKFS